MDKYSKSQTLFNRAKNSLVGGVNSPVRSFSRVGGKSLLADRAQGAYLWDVDDNRYLDFVLSYGPHLFGHNYQAVVENIKEALKKAWSFGMTAQAEIEWAELMKESTLGTEKVRAVNSGTEACMTAVRMARAYTHRDVIVKFAGHYHGHSDYLLMDTGSGAATLSTEAVAGSAGIPKNASESMRVLEFNDESSLEQIFANEGEKIAGVILEAVMGNMGVIPATQNFINKLRTLCDKHGSVLIFDEVMTGFRVHEKSAAGYYDVLPDLSCFGKVVGGGMPLAAVVGKKDLMDCLAPIGSVYQAGTLSGNSLAIAAGIAMLQEVKERNPQKQLETCGEAVEKIWSTALDSTGVDYSLSRVGSMFSVFFRKELPANATEARDIRDDIFANYFWQCADQGILLPPSPFEAYFLSTEHFDAIDNLELSFDFASK